MEKFGKVSKVLLATVGGWALTVLTLQVPLGFSDAQEATVGRIYYYGFPIPHGVAPGYSIMYSAGRALYSMPFNLAFWVAVILALLCWKNWRQFWKLFITIVILHCSLVGIMWLINECDITMGT